RLYLFFQSPSQTAEHAVVRSICEKGNPRRLSNKYGEIQCKQVASREGDPYEYCQLPTPSFLPVSASAGDAGWCDLTVKRANAGSGTRRQPAWQTVVPCQ